MTITLTHSQQDAICDIAEPIADRMADDLAGQFVYDYHSLHDCFRLGGSVEFDGYDFRVDKVEDGEVRVDSMDVSTYSKKGV